MLKHRWFIYGSVLLTVLAVAFGGIEAVARAWQYRIAQSKDGWELVGTRFLYYRVLPESQVYTMLPYSHYNYEGVAVDINSQGMRDDEHSLDKPPGLKRILLLGDSVVMGWEVALEDTFGKQLESALNQKTGQPYEVISAGIPGWNLRVQKQYLEHFGAAYQPDAIIAYFTTLNDINPRYDCPTMPDIPQSALRHWLNEHLVSATFVPSMIRQLRDQLFPPVSAQANPVSQSPTYPFPLDMQDPQWARCVYDPIHQMAALAEAQGARFIVVVLPTDLQVRHVDYPTVPQTVFAQIAAEQGVTVLDLLPLFREQYQHNPDSREPDSDNPLFADYYSHPSPLGNGLTALATYDLLQGL
jgi:hypothetical protein